MSTLVDSSGTDCRPRPPAPPQATSGQAASVRGAPTLWCMPFFVIFVAMIIVPLVYAGYLSLFKKRLIGGTQLRRCWRTTSGPSPIRSS